MPGVMSMSVGCMKDVPHPVDKRFDGSYRIGAYHLTELTMVSASVKLSLN